LNVTIYAPTGPDAAVAVDHVAPLIDKALKKQEIEEDYPLDWVRHQVKTGRMQLWIAYVNNKIAGVLTTDIHTYPGGGKWLQLFTVGGWGMERWVERLWNDVKRYARAVGCKKVAGGGRLGWLGVIKQLEPLERVKRDSTVIVRI